MWVHAQRQTDALAVLRIHQSNKEVTQRKENFCDRHVENTLPEETKFSKGNLFQNLSKFQLCHLDRCINLKIACYQILNP